jgi:hypothetical protein
VALDADLPGLRLLCTVVDVSAEHYSQGHPQYQLLKEISERREWLALPGQSILPVRWSPPEWLVKVMLPLLYQDSNLRFTRFDLRNCEAGGRMKWPRVKQEWFEERSIPRFRHVNVAGPLR